MKGIKTKPFPLNMEGIKTKPLPLNMEGIKTKPFPLNMEGIKTKPLPLNMEGIKSESVPVDLKGLETNSLYGGKKSPKKEQSLKLDALIKAAAKKELPIKASVEKEVEISPKKEEASPKKPSEFMQYGGSLLQHLKKKKYECNCGPYCDKFGSSLRVSCRIFMDSKRWAVRR
jgi:hypothetical protein